MGKGRIVILGNSAHPLRHTGQDENLALEDAAELGAAVMQFGLSKEALRRFEQRRRPRWKHVMQVGSQPGWLAGW
jgi:2-polyprenyl-6-methoxyphenol hydroxylase-like FAD-dependent oxidoreductase